MGCIPQESRGRHRRKHDLRCRGVAVHPATRTSTLRLNIIRHPLMHNAVSNYVGDFSEHDCVASFSMLCGVEKLCAMFQL